MSADRPISATERGRNSMSIALRLTVSILVICLFRRSVRLACIQRGDASFIPAKHATQHFTGMFGQQRRRAVGGSVGPLEHERSEEHTSELQSLMRNSYAVFCLKKKYKLSYKQ